ncbi:MAG: glycosyltransferase family 4 protein [Solirubrobacteraceae bacterium]|jgi:glycosyltransferase involved in cell wall biosynthesis
MHVWLAPSAFFPHRGGVEEATLQLARELGRRGHEVLVVTNQPSPSLASNAVCEGVEVRRLAFTAPRLRPLQLASFTVSQPRLQASLDALRPRPDVVHVQCASTQTAPLLLYTRRHRLPLVLTSQGETVMDAHQIYQRSLYMRLSFRAAARAAAALTACSAWTAQHCIRYAPRFDSATIIANGVDVSQWDVEPPPSAPVLCAWGRHVPAKGFDLAIAGFALLRQQVSDARLLIGGEGVDTPRLRTLAGDGVEFVGPLDRDGVRALLGASRVAVVPSRIEPFGIVALEALAAGRGLVYARDTGLGEAAGACGRPADVHDPAALAKAMSAELASPTDPAAGRVRARELSWRRICDEYLAVYGEALAERPTRRRRAAA